MKRRKLVYFLLIITLSIPLLLAACSNGTTPTPTTSQPPATESPETPGTPGGTDLKDVKLPDFISFASYDVGSATFAQVAGLCEGIMNVTGIKPDR